MPPIRLQKLLSTAGVASRRAAEALIVEGRVTVNGRTVSQLGSKADPERDDVRVDGRRVRPVERFRYILLNKPAGVVTTVGVPHDGSSSRIVFHTTSPVRAFRAAMNEPFCWSH